MEDGERKSKRAAAVGLKKNSKITKEWINVTMLQKKEERKKEGTEKCTQ